MTPDVLPMAGKWYQDIDRKKVFQVLSVNQDEDVVEIQNYDGDLEQLSMAEWNEMILDMVEAPEDWAGPFGELEPDDFGDAGV
ncbi:MAG TPA: hypothetical protein EYP57_10405 [Thermodesulfobacteriaceae bacterium]|nr:hypothetical protein [Thermodesulfobacteriaceae bacterium]